MTHADECYIDNKDDRALSQVLLIILVIIVTKCGGELSVLAIQND